MTVRFTRSTTADPLPDQVLTDLAGAVGDHHVVADDEARSEAGQDWWPLALTWVQNGDQPALPQVVVRPGSADEVAAVLRVANTAKIPVTPFGGRSGVVGGSLPVVGGISLDMRRIDAIHDINVPDLVVHTDAGVFGPKLEDALQDEGLTCGHFPQSWDLATVGGWIACRGVGQFSNRYGKIEDMVLGLEVVLADGTIMRTNPQPRTATGPELARLFVGAEGTLGVITSAWLQVWPTPSTTAKRVYSFTSFKDTLEAQRRAARRHALPACMRSYDAGDTQIHFNAFDIEDDRSLLIIVAEGDPGEVGYELQAVDEVIDSFGDDVARADDAIADHWMANRNDVSALEEVIGRGIVVDTIEIAAPWSKLPAIYSSVRTSILNVEATVTAVAHASHSYLSGGCLYFTFAGTPGFETSEKDRYYNACWDAAMAAVIDGGGTISHHHGIGVNRARFMAAELGAGGMTVLRSVKNALDPNGIMNPGKLGLGPDVWP